MASPLHPNRLGKGSIEPVSAFRYEHIGRLASIVSIIAGLTVILGSFTGQSLLTGFNFGYALITPDTAVCFILLGMGLWLQRPSNSLPSVLPSCRLRCARLFALAVAGVGLLTLAEHLFHLGWGLDPTILPDAMTHPPHLSPGRMSSGTALGCFFLGLSLFFLGGGKNWTATLSQALALIVVIEAQISFLGSFYRMSHLQVVPPHTAMSLPTCLLFILISAGIFCSRPHEGFISILTSKRSGGYLARHILPLAVTLPFLLGWLSLKGEEAGYYGNGFGLALFATSNIILFTTLVWLGARTLNDRASALLTSESRFLFLADTIPQIIWTAKPDGGIDYYNHQWTEYSGLTFEQTRDSGWQSALHPDDAETCIELWEISLGTGLNFEAEYRFKRASDGVYRWHLGRAFALRDENGKIIQWVGTCTDIDDQKRARAKLEERVAERTLELRQSEERLNAILNSSLDGVIVYSSLRDEKGKIRDFRFEMINPAAEKLMRQDTSDFIGSSLLEKFPHLQADDLFDKLIKIAEENISLDFEYMSSREEKKRWYRIAGVKLGDGMVLSYTEITARKLFELDLQEAKTRAESADRAKSEFLAIMSHEIRTPMNGVIGMTGILADTELNEMQRECVSTIHNSGESLLAVINDILDYSKIEAGRLQLESRSFNLQKCVEEALDLFAAQIRMKQLEGLYLIAPETPPNLIGDPLRLRQILVNLIGNAVKFTPRGEIVINVECTQKNAEGCHLLFSVTDTGIGIPGNALEKLFQAFQQVDTSTTRRYGGTGLGLVISKRLAESMGGRMWVESKPGEGSTFFFTAFLKVSKEIPLEDRTPDSSLLRSHSVLIVDDNATNRRVLETQLKIWGMSSTSVSSGAEALEKLKSQSFDAGLIDFQMPDLDGVHLAREIRETGNLPLILLSSSGELLQGEEAGLFNFQIPKPIKHSVLFNALLRIMGPEVKPTLAAPEKRFDSGLAARYPLSILLAEDNAVNQKVGLLMLSRLGYQAALAANGREAVAAAEKNSYDLILMDIQMPEMNGIEATRIIRTRLAQNCPKIVALTAEALEGDEAKFLAQGFDAYLSKPLQTHKLQETLKAVAYRLI